MNEKCQCETCKHYASVNAVSHVGICIAQNEWHIVEGSDRLRFCCEYQPEKRREVITDGQIR